jgi:hypothetical protein
MPKISIEYTLPQGADKESVANFVVDALESWGGQFHPEDPLFGSLRGHMKRIIVNHKDYSSLLTQMENA